MLENGQTMSMIGGLGVFGVIVTMGHYVPAFIALSIQGGFFAYGLWLRKPMKFCVSRVDYSFNTHQVRIYPGVDNDTDYIET